MRFNVRFLLGLTFYAAVAAAIWDFTAPPPYAMPLPAPYQTRETLLRVFITGQWVSSLLCIHSVLADRWRSRRRQ